MSIPRRFVGLVCLSFLLFTSFAQAQHHHHSAEVSEEVAGDCGDWGYYDPFSNMCQRLSRPGEKNWTFMLHGNAFAVGNVQTGVRQANKLAFPNYAMADAGRTVGSKHYLNVSLMLTAERWTFPEQGYPEYGQIGEENEDHQPFVDAQHPHSSPIMGLTFSDTIAIGEQKDFVRVSFAPRGASTDGPIAFMHRPTGVVNPDAPLGHHLGQDVGHISSTVVAAALKLGPNLMEASGFNGDEPEPMKVNMPMGALNSMAVRYSREINRHVTAMASYAYVKNTEHNPNDRDAVRRVSASVYTKGERWGWQYNNALIYGAAYHLEGLRQLSSAGEEFLVEKEASQIFGRLELVERTPSQLQISVGGDPLRIRTVTSLTGGYTYRLIDQQDWQLGLGGSFNNVWLPAEYQGAYTGSPWTARVFVRVSGMKML